MKHTKTKESNAIVTVVYVHNGKAITEKEAKAKERDFASKDLDKLITWVKVCTRPNSQSFIYIHSHKEREVDLNTLVSKY